MGYIGTLAVEFSVVRGQLLINEMAPRPHNSGHYTIDACVASQFEQQVRTLCGLPLARTHQHSPAVMVNLLGDLWQPALPDWSRLFDKPGLALHLYGKHHARAGRKMGHFTVLSADLRRAVDVALSARGEIGISDDPS